MYSADIPPHLRVDATPLAHPESVVRGDRWRFTVLTDGLVRAEWSDDGVFEDRASTFALHRDLPVPPFRVVEGAETLEIVTSRLHLRYDRKPFSPSGLRVRPLGAGRGLEDWKFGEVEDLGGTARTLDGVNGRHPLESGVVSRKGVAVIDDSGSLLFTDDGWVSPRDGERTDLYVFAYAHDYGEALRALYAVSGSQPILPRWALGNWWSRFHRYTADEYVELLDRFEREGIRFSVAVLDMDWHRVDSVPAEFGSGWTGYSWEPEFFPDPEAFLAEVHRRGMKVTLNLHPADGVRAFEDAYPALAEALGRDPELGERIAFEINDPEFLEAYLAVLHHPLEAQGVDFWWMDWQHGPHSRVTGIDPLWLLNHFHFLDAARDGGRPLSSPATRDRAVTDTPSASRATCPQLGVAGVPARVHGHRIERRVRLVEPRHRRPHVRLARRRAHRPLGAARRLLARSSGCTRPTTRSSRRSRGPSPPRRARRSATRCACACAWCRTCMR